MDVFVYGTLTDPERADRLLDAYEFAGEAVLEGLHRVEGSYPTLAPGGTVEGRLLRTAEVETLDEYEGVDRGLYARVSVPFGDDETSPERVAVYVGDPDALDAPAEWPGDGPFETRVRTYLRDHDVRVRPT